MTAVSGPTIYVVCDYRGCRAKTQDFSHDFYNVPLEPGWERWLGSRCRMDYCPEHAARPKARTMRRTWPDGAS